MFTSSAVGMHLSLSVPGVLPSGMVGAPHCLAEVNALSALELIPRLGVELSRKASWRRCIWRTEEKSLGSEKSLWIVLPGVREGALPWRSQKKEMGGVRCRLGGAPSPAADQSLRPPADRWVSYLVRSTLGDPWECWDTQGPGCPRHLNHSYSRAADHEEFGGKRTQSTWGLKQAGLPTAQEAARQARLGTSGVPGQPSDSGPWGRPAGLLTSGPPAASPWYNPGGGRRSTSPVGQGLGGERRAGSPKESCGLSP